MKRVLGIGLVGLFVLSGCPRGSWVPTVTSGDAVDDRAADLGLDPGERRALRADISRRLRLLEANEDEGPLQDASRRRLQGALDALAALDRAESTEPSPRDAERSALRALGSWLAASLETELSSLPAAAPEQTEDGPFARALAAQRAGDVDGAVHEGLIALQQLVDSGVDSAALRYRLGEWAAHLGDGELAAELFETAVVVAESQRWIAERGPVEAARSRAASLGPDGVALAEARALAAAGDLGGAHAQLEALTRATQDSRVRDDAQSMLRAVIGQAQTKAASDLARADALLAGPGPYDGVGPLLDGVRALPASCVDQEELLRLLAWQQSRAKTSTGAERAAQQTAAEAALADARGLVVAREYRAGIAAYRKLDGTTLQTVARREAREAAETLVRQERERAGALFVAAKKVGDPGKKRAALDEVRGILAGVLAEFPDSSFADRLRANLAAVEQELRALGGG